MVKVLAKYVNGLMLAGNVCPITGKRKEPGFRVADEAIKKYPNANEAVDTVLEAYRELDNGHRIALGGDNERKRVFGPVLCQVKVAKDAKWCNPKNGIKPFLSYAYSARGGLVNASVFGADEKDAGKIICVLAELKIRKAPTGREYPYFRFQKVDGVRSDVKFAIRHEDSKFDVLEFVYDLPCKVIDHYTGGKIGQDRYLYFAVGFVPIC